MRQIKNINNDHFIKEGIDMDWDRYQLIPYVENAWNYLLSEFTKVVDKHAPMKNYESKGQ